MNDQVKLEIVVDDKGSLVIKNFRAGLGGIPKESEGAGSALTHLWQKMALGDLVASGIKATYSAFVGVLKSSVGEYMRAEEGNAALRQTLVNLGDTTGVAFDALEKYAAQIQATTVVDDDMAKSLMQLGLNMGIPIEQIGGATEAAIGLTRAFKGMSLDAAMKATAAALEGNTQKLQRYIPELKETATESEKLAIVQKAMADGLKIAHNEITTGPGKIKQWKNAWGDVQESIGKLLVEAVLPMAESFKEFFSQNKDLLVGFVQSLVSGFSSIVDASQWVIEALGKVLGFVQNLSPIVDAIVNGWRNLLVLFTNELGSTYDKLGESINREAEQEMKAINRFREAAAAAGIQGEEIRKLSEKYKDVEDAGIKHERMLRDLIKTHPELADKLKASAVAGAGVSLATNDLTNAFKVNIPKVKELTEAEKQHKKAAEEAAAMVKKYGLDTKGFNEAGRQMYFELLQLVGILPRFTSETQAAADEQRRLGLDTGELTEAGRELYVQLLQLGGYIPTLNDGVKDSTDDVDEWKFSWGEARSALGDVRGSLAELGIDLGPLGDAFLDVADSAMGFIDALATGNPLAIIAAGLSLIVDVVNLVAEAFGKVNVQIANQNVAMAIANVEMVKFGVVATQAMEDAAKAAGKFNVALDNMNNAIDTAKKLLSDFQFPDGTIPKGNPKNPDFGFEPDVFAAGGFYSPRLSSDTLIQAHEGEGALIVPKSKNNGAWNQPGSGSDGAKGGDTYFTWHLHNVIDANNVLDIMGKGIDDNDREIRSKLLSLKK